EWLKGKTLAEAEAIRNKDIAHELELPAPKVHCSVLAEDAIASAIADWKKKNAKA
ncbi:MAG TPA: Fe-S cluster assembly scaffold IscU, partial [Phycisphaerales bacterium]|nr:Fe-S cluster assembly scaffold IscU [Phycisphaerales bacterium]